MRIRLSPRHWLYTFAATAIVIYSATNHDQDAEDRSLVDVNRTTSQQSVNSRNSQRTNMPVPITKTFSGYSTQRPAVSGLPQHEEHSPPTESRDPMLSEIDKLDVNELVERYFSASTPEISLQILERLWSETPAAFQHEQLEFILADAQRSENDQLRRIGELFLQDMQQFAGGTQDELKAIQSLIAEMQLLSTPPSQPASETQKAPVEHPGGTSSFDQQDRQDLLESLTYLATYADDLDIRMGSINVLRDVDTQRALLAVEENLSSSRMPQERQLLVEVVSGMTGSADADSLRNILAKAAIDPDDMVATAAVAAIRILDGEDTEMEDLDGT